MLFFKRLLTALALLGVFFLVLWTVAMMVGGGIAGAQATTALQQNGQAAPANFQEGLKIGAMAGIRFRAQYGQTVGRCALGVSTVLALWLTFGGVLPWCRGTTPPPLPANHRPYPPR